MEDKYVVWYSEEAVGANAWLPSESMTREEADMYASWLQNGGFTTVISPRLKVTRADWIEG